MSHCVAFTNAMKETNEGDLTGLGLGLGFNKRQR